MEHLDYWRLCDELSVIQAALLVAGHEPSSSVQYNAERLISEKKPVGYEAAKAAISSALKRGAIKGQIYPGDFEDSIDIDKSWIEVGSLRAWLSERGLKTGFFFPEKAAIQDYLNPKHARYAPKLAAAVFAWLATEALSATKGKSPKQALTKWLREHASSSD